MIRIIDYGMGNSASIRNMIHKVGGRAEITRDPKQIASADKLILPGVGHFKKAMGYIKEYDLQHPLNDAVHNRKIPVLGICLGMQLLTSHSEEGDVEGLNFVPGKTIKFQFESNDLKVPHMGWNHVHINQVHPCFEGLEDSRFYFVHKYFVRTDSEQHVLTTTNYGHDFHSSIVNENVIGVQYHPEKSHKFGMQFFKNFIKL